MNYIIFLAKKDESINSLYNTFIINNQNTNMNEDSINFIVNYNSKNFSKYFQYIFY